jgi:Fe-S-cluster containining protein
MNILSKIRTANRIMPIDELGGKKKLITPKKSNFKCYHCGYCCTQAVRLGEEDIINITNKGYAKKEFIDSTFFKGGISIKLVNGFCYFLKIEHGLSSCKIYSIRPLVCRSYPFFENNTAICCPPTLWQSNPY